MVENREFFIPHLYLAPPQGVTPSEFREDVFDANKTRMIGLPYGEKNYDDMLSRFYRSMHMHKRGICRHAVSVCLSVCLSVCHVRELRQYE